jgi:hypothetical protein
MALSRLHAIGVIAIVAVLSASSYYYLVVLPDDTGGGDDNGGGNPDAGTFYRPVLIESFTSTDCYWCLKEEEPALHKLYDNYSRDEIIILTYHGHVGVDPFQTADAIFRADYYGDIHGTPTVFFDGGNRKSGGTGRGVDAMVELYTKKVVARTGIKPDFEIALNVTVNATANKTHVNVAATVSRTSTGESASYANHMLRFVLTEGNLTANNFVFDWVVRDFQQYWIENEDMPFSQEHVFEVEDGWDFTELDVLAFLQNDTSNEVVQAAFGEV